MPAQTINDVKDRVEAEGFEYAFISYSDFAEVNDPEFHRRRKAYVDARNELAAYIGLEE
jgi:hypothetical protein